MFAYLRRRTYAALALTLRQLNGVIRNVRWRSAVVQAAAKPVCYKSCSVLIIEDRVDVRESFRMLLSLVGCRVETAEDGEEGVRKALASHPKVAFVDIGLPLLDGMEVARQIRASLGRQIYLIACTAYDERYRRERSKADQFDAWLVKPVALQDMLHWLEAACIALN
jgi:CheY-like chemotaxis protein